MRSAPTHCPVCGGDLAVTRLVCPGCDTSIEGTFMPSPFSGLSPEQINFVWAFVRCEGRFNRLEKELGLSYPTLRNRLHEVIRALGFEPWSGEVGRPSATERRQVLERLERGEIDAAEAVRLLSGGNG